MHKLNVCKKSWKKSSAYADNTPYFYHKNFELLFSKFQIRELKLLEWFSSNYMKMNSDKCHHILSSNDENKKTELNGEVIKSKICKYKIFFTVILILK